MATYRIQEETLTKLSDSVRGVSRKTEKMSPETMSSSLDKIAVAENTTFPADTPENYNSNVFTVQGDFFSKLYELLQDKMSSEDYFTLEDLVSTIQQDVDFWDVYQNNNNDYDYAFSGSCWTLDIFKPKYDFKPFYAQAMFIDNRFGGNLTEILDRLGIELDFSNCINMTSCFAYSFFEELGVIDTTKTQGSYSIFNYAQRLRKIEKIIVSPTANFNAWFNICVALEHVEFEGNIAQNGLNLQWSTKLDKESITSIINCLSTTTTGLTVTFSKTAVNKAFASEEGGNDGDESNEWNELVSSKPNWNISLV